MSHAYPVGSQDHNRPSWLDGLGALDCCRDQQDAGRAEQSAESEDRGIRSPDRDRQTRAAPPLVAGREARINIGNDGVIRRRRERTLGVHDVGFLGRCSGGAVTLSEPVGSGFRRRSISVAGPRAGTRRRRFSEEEERLFFFFLGYRFYATTLRGSLMGHRRPMSAARDYLDFESLNGLDREASEFLVDIARIGQHGYLSFEEVVQKWVAAANWRPEVPVR